MAKEGHSAKRKEMAAAGAIWPRETRPAISAVEGHLRDLGPRGVAASVLRSENSPPDCFLYERKGP